MLDDFDTGTRFELFVIFTRLLSVRTLPILLRLAGNLGAQSKSFRPSVQYSKRDDLQTTEPEWLSGMERCNLGVLPDSLSVLPATASQNRQTEILDRHLKNDVYYLSKNKNAPPNSLHLQCPYLLLSRQFLYCSRRDFPENLMMVIIELESLTRLSEKYQENIIRCPNQLLSFAYERILSHNRITQY